MKFSGPVRISHSFKITTMGSDDCWPLKLCTDIYAFSFVFTDRTRLHYFRFKKKPSHVDELPSFRILTIAPCESLHSIYKHST